VGRAWRQHLSNVSRILHPWRLADSTRQTSKEVEEQLRAELEAIETLLEANGLPMKTATLDKVRKQLAGISALVDLWWQTVRQDLTQLAMTPKWTQWAEDVLLPRGSVHMTQDIYGKQFLPTVPTTCKYKKSKADISRPANRSCSPSILRRGVRRCKARCWTLLHCVSSSSSSSSCGDANTVWYNLG
jgi:hypothetical protein